MEKKEGRGGVKKEGVGEALERREVGREAGWDEEKHAVFGDA